jgi:hypothetical protein
MMLAIAILANGGLLLADDVQLTSNFDEAEDVATVESVAATYATNATPVKPQPTPAGAPGKAGCDCGCGSKGCGSGGCGSKACGSQACGSQACGSTACGSTACGSTACGSGACAKCGNQGNCCDKCGKCGDCCGCRSWGPYSEPCPRFVSSFFSGVDSFRGVTNGRFENNNGALTGLNLGGQLLPDLDIGWQFGASYGDYNFSGRTSPGAGPNVTTQQIFVTTGFFRRANSDRRLSWGIVHDWMFTNNFGAFGNSPTLSQFRGQVAWAVSDRNEFGVWATVYDRTTTRATGALGTPISYQAIDQGNLFWHHKYAAYGADSWFYVGVPLDQRIAQTPNPAFPVGGYGGSLGSMIVGTNWLLPITDRLSGYANVMYMKPSARQGVSPTGAVAAAQEFWNIGAGLTWYPGRAARSRTVAGRQWMPYMPVANNSSFLVDATKTE